jgi:hypothetical protein
MLTCAAYLWNDSPLPRRSGAYRNDTPTTVVRQEATRPCGVAGFHGESRPVTWVISLPELHHVIA